jgi:Zn-dependent peptidase ImmA (M78 family)
MLVPPPLPLPERVRTADDAVSLAQRIRAGLGQASGPLGSLAAVAERLGLFLTVIDVDADGASLFLEAYGVAVIGNTEPGRRRWTAAHELGHHVMRDEYHSDIGVAASRDEREQLIEAFAGEFLLPAQDLVVRADRLKDPRAMLVEVAADYRLSWSAAVDRARRTGLVDVDEAQRLRARAPVRGDFLALLGREPEPDLPVGDHGPLWMQAVLRAHHAGLITGDRAVELLGTRITAEELPDPESW